MGKSLTVPAVAISGPSARAKPRVELVHPLTNQERRLAQRVLRNT